MRRDRAALVLWAVAASASGCKGCSRRDEIVRPPDVPSTLVVAGRHAPRRAVWTAAGDVVAMSAESLYRVKPVAGALPAVIPVASGAWDIAAARDADVVVVISDSGELSALRGDSLTPFARVRSAHTNNLAVAGDVVAVRESQDGGAVSTAFYRISNGQRLSSAPLRGATLSPSGAYALEDGVVVSTADGTRALARASGKSAGWIGESAIFSEESAVVWVDVPSKRTQTIPASPECEDGKDTVDAALARVIRICERHVSFFRPGAARVDVPFDAPKLAIATLRLLEGSEDVIVELDGIGGNSQALRISPKDRTATPIAARARLREPVGDALASRTWAWAADRVPLPNANGELALRVGSGFLEVLRADGGPVVKLGVDPCVRDGISAIEAHAGGIETLGERDASLQRLLRVGPSAPPLAPLPEQTLDVFAEDTCVRTERRRVADGEIRFNTGAPVLRPAAVCFCASGKCRTVELAPHLAMVEATASRLVAKVAAAPLTSLVLLGLDGKEASRLEIDRQCPTARAAPDGKTLALACKGAKLGEGEVIEVALSPLALTRRTPLPPALVDILGDPSPMLAAASKAFLLATPGLGAMGSTMIEAGSGRPLADLFLWPHAGVVRYADGRIELAGDRATAESAVFCRDGAALRSFEKCRGAALVEGRFRFE